jgi:hypothetical protein
MESMRRQEAVSIIKEIGSSCKLLNPKGIDLEQGNNAEHYEIHITSSVDDENWQCLKAIAKKYSLGIKLTDKTLIIYRTQNKKNDKLVKF